MQNLCFCKTILSLNKIKNQKNRNEFQMYITKTKISYSLNYQTLHYCHKQKPILPIEGIQLLIIFSSFKKRNQKTKKKKNGNEIGNSQSPKIALSVVASKTKTIENLNSQSRTNKPLKHIRHAFPRQQNKLERKKKKTDDSVSILHSPFLIPFYGNADHPEYFPPCHVTSSTLLSLKSNDDLSSAFFHHRSAIHPAAKFISMTIIEIFFCGDARTRIRESVPSSRDSSTQWREQRRE